MTYQRKVTLTDAELLERFRNDCIRFSDIAAECGVSRERIRQIYNARFKHLCPGRKSGHQRVKVCTRKRAAVMMKRVAVMDPVHDVALEAVVRATAAGLEAHGAARVSRGTVVVNGREYTQRHLRVPPFYVTVNGVLCHVRKAARFASRWSVRSDYWRVKHIKTLAAYTIALCGDETYIIPSALFTRPVRGDKDIFIPVARLAHGPGSGVPGPKPRFDFEPYRNAWELIR